MTLHSFLRRPFSEVLAEFRRLSPAQKKLHIHTLILKSQEAR